MRQACTIQDPALKSSQPLNRPLNGVSSQKVGSSLSVAKNSREQVDLGIGVSFNRPDNSAIVPRWKPAGL